jgi:hypothetical protein
MIEVCGIYMDLEPVMARYLDYKGTIGGIVVAFEKDMAAACIMRTLAQTLSNLIGCYWFSINQVKAITHKAIR